MAQKPEKQTKLPISFFARQADIVAKDLLGKILVRKISNQILKAKIVETEAYFGENDPASRASKGKNKISEMMWSKPGTIMLYNVHKYIMFNIVTDKKEIPSAVLIRALEPLNFKARCSGPGLLTLSMDINKQFHGKDIMLVNDLIISNSSENPEISSSKRIGITQDLPKPLRFFIKGNRFVSR